MIRVLFVDDDPDILEGLENRMHTLDQRMEADYVTSGAEALRRVDSIAYSAVVTDMRMPQMDGAELLHRVKSLHPSIVRIILSGETGANGFMRALHVAHQVLAKPCDIRRLHQVLLECHALRERLSAPEIVQAVGAMNTLPSSPKICIELDEVMSSPATSMADMAAVIEKDAGMTARVLQVVNSAYFSARTPVQNVRDAVKYLGTEMIRGLALAHELYGSLKPEQPPACRARLLAEQDDALLAARIAKRLVTAPDLQPLAFTAGILHNIGRIALLDSNRDCASGADVDHRLLGAYLLSMWGLPFKLIESVAYAGTPSLRECRFPPESDLSGVLHLTQAFVTRYRQRCAPGDGYDSAGLDALYLQRAGLNDGALTQLERAVRGDLNL